MAIRVYLGKLPSGDYGLKVISADGTTVIIDGTSNMFKIIATGTMSLSSATGVFQTTTATLTALGTFSTTPGQVAYMSGNNVTTSGRLLSNYFLVPAGPGYVAGTSGGSPTNPAITPTLFARFYTKLDGSSQCVITLENDNANGPNPQVVYCTYYVLQEAAL